MQNDEEAQKGGDANASETVKRPTFDAHEIEALRKRLYSRGLDNPRMVRHGVPPRTNTASVPVQSTYTPQTPPTPPAQTVVQEVGVSDTIVDMPKSTRNKFRKLAAIVAVVFFVCATAISTTLIFWGGNTISGENISITASGGIAVGGGEAYDFQVSVANQNNVAIQSATLIVEYPKGTRSLEEGAKEISIEHHVLETIEQGQLVNVPLKARIYGEENEEKQIKVWIEYRVAGSNATFEKHANPLLFKVTTSPVIITLDTVNRISSGQEVEIDMVIQSNSPTPLTNLLIKSAYPEGFDFTESDPETSSGEDTWKINSLKPNEKKTITIKGLLTGYEDDVRKFSVAIGVPKEGVENTLVSPLASTFAEITIEQPFLDAEVRINGSQTETVVVQKEKEIDVQIEYKNTLSTTIYDGKVQVTLDGSAFSGYDIFTQGSYTEDSGVISWDSSTESGLEEVLPGESVPLNFTLSPRDVSLRTPQINMSLNVSAKRSYESVESDTLVGDISRTIKIESVPSLVSQTNYSEGPFTNTGPLPPVVGKTTQYTYLLTAKADANDLTAVEVTAVLPQGVTWLDLVTTDDDVSYNPTTRTMKWVIGDMSANTEVGMGAQVSFVPNENQEGKIPTILEVQRFKATDRFTGTAVRAEAPALTTTLTGTEKDLARVKGE